MKNITRNTYSVEEAARILGISRSHAYKVVTTGELPSITLGERILIPITALEQLLTPNNNQSRLSTNNRKILNLFDINATKYSKIAGEFRRNRNTGPVTIDVNTQRQEHGG